MPELSRTSRAAKVVIAQPPTATLDVQRVDRSGFIPDDDQFQTWVDAALLAGWQGTSVGIRVVSLDEARRYNRDYRGKHHATNILSFPVELPAGLPDEVRHSQLGDLLICAPVVARESVAQKRPEHEHWAHLTIHGILHLQGYMHERAEQARVMESLETEILAGLGIPDPYREID